MKVVEINEGLWYRYLLQPWIRERGRRCPWVNPRVWKFILGVYNVMTTTIKKNSAWSLETRENSNEHRNYLSHLDHILPRLHDMPNTKTNRPSTFLECNLQQNLKGKQDKERVWKLSCKTKLRRSNVETINPHQERNHRQLHLHER